VDAVAQLVWMRSRVKNEIHAVLMRRLPGRAPFADLFGVKGRRWLAELELPVEERETVDAGMRQIEFLDAEIAQVERLIARDALSSPEIKRLMTVPGVNVIVAASFVAAIGDIGRFRTPRKLGRLPRVGPARAAIGQRPRQPRPDLQAGVGPRPPRPGGVMLDRGPPARPTARVLPAGARSPRTFGRHRRRRPQARVPVLGAAHASKGDGIWSANQAVRRAERELAHQAEVAYTPHRPRLPRHPGDQGRGRDTGDAHRQAVKTASSATGHPSQTLRFSSSSPTLNPTLPKGAPHKSKRP
jgi:hypothetical protein